jgi:hypothetical protein
MFRVGPEDRHRRLVAFVARGTEGKDAAAWDRAAKDVYGFESVDALEQAWIDWLKTPGSRVGGPVAPKAGEPDLIPPTKLPPKP